MEFRDTTDDWTGYRALLSPEQIKEERSHCFPSSTALLHCERILTESQIAIQEYQRALGLVIFQNTARTNPRSPRFERTARSRVVESCQDATGSVSSFSRTTPTYA